MLSVIKNQFPAYEHIFVRKRMNNTPELLFVLNEEKENLNEWHKINRLMNSEDYAPLSNFFSSNKYIHHCPLKKIAYKNHANEILEDYFAYSVVDSKTLIKSINDWTSYFLVRKFSDDFYYPYKNLSNNLLQAIKFHHRTLIRLAALTLPESFKFFDLIDKISPNTSLFCKLKVAFNYLDDLQDVDTKHKRNYSENQFKILTGKYKPYQYSKFSLKKQDEDYLTDKFDFRFENKQDLDLLTDVRNQVKPILDKVILRNEIESYTKSKELSDAISLLVSKKFDMFQTYTNIAHCSLYNTLPNILKNYAANLSSGVRLLKTYNFINLSDRNTELLGGPLPWEKKNIERAYNLWKIKTSIDNPINYLANFRFL